MCQDKDEWASCAHRIIIERMLVENLNFDKTGPNKFELYSDQIEIIIENNNEFIVHFNGDYILPEEKVQYMDMEDLKILIGELLREK